MFETILYNFNLDNLWYIVKKRIIFCIIVAILGAVAGGFFAVSNSSTLYAATVSFYVYSDPDYVTDSSVNISASEFSTAKALVESYTMILKSDSVLQLIIDELQLPYTSAYLKTKISSVPVENTAIFYVHVFDADPTNAMNIANAIADYAPDEVIRIVKSGGIEVIDKAALPTAPYESTNVAKYMILGGGAGFVLLFAVFLVMGLVDSTIRSKKELTDMFTIPIIGEVPLLDSLCDDSKVVSNDSPFAIKESYSNICTNLLYTGKGEKCPVYVFTSASQDDGKSLSCVNVAKSMKNLGKKVLVIDGDFRNHSIDNLINRDVNNDLCQYLAGINDNVDILMEDGVSFMLINKIPPNPTELVASKTFAASIKKLRDSYDYIFIDMPPCGIVSDTLIIKDLITSYIMVARADKNKIADIRKVVTDMELVEADICGFILNGINPKSKGYAYSKYKKDYSYNKDKKRGN